MATYQINIDENNIAGKHFLKYMKTLPFISITKNKEKKRCGIDEALEDIRMGRVEEIKDIDMFFKQVRWEVENEI